MRAITIGLDIAKWFFRFMALTLTASFQKMPPCLVVLGCLLFGGYGFLTIRRNVAGALFPKPVRFFNR